MELERKERREENITGWRRRDGLARRIEIEEKERKEKRKEARRGRMKWWMGPKGVRPGILKVGVCESTSAAAAGPRRETSELARVDREGAEPTPTVPTSDYPRAKTTHPFLAMAAMFLHSARIAKPTTLPGQLYRVPVRSRMPRRMLLRCWLRRTAATASCYASTFQEQCGLCITPFTSISHPEPVPVQDRQVHPPS